ncbi:MAG: hypothetical protein R3A51_19355 [Nannocystaceae bacterium]
MLSRRSWLAIVPVAGLSASLPARARAAAVVEAAAANKAVGALVAATGGDAVRVVIDAGLAPTQLRLDGAVVDIGQRIRLPGDPKADRRFLDDPRNAPRLGGNIRDAIASRHPELAAKVNDNHKAWTRSIARQIMDWNRQLESSKVKGQAIADAYGRAALLVWAGATIDPKSANRGPASLARLPEEPSAATLAAYGAYVEALIAAVR